MYRVQAGLARLKSRTRKLYRNPAAFAADFPNPVGRVLLRTTVLLLLFCGDVLALHFWLARFEWILRRIALRPAGGIHTLEDFRLMSPGHGEPVFWPNRVLIRASADSVICALGTDDQFIAGGSVGSGRGLALRLDRSPAFLRTYGFSMQPRELTIKPVSSTEIFLMEFVRGVGIDIALKRAWPVQPRPAQGIARGSYNTWLRQNPLPVPSPSDVLVSVVMPVRDPLPGLLQSAIRSVLIQTHSRLELCIADDGSLSRETLAVLEGAISDPRVRLVRLEASRGISAATNAALALATGSVVCFMDHDDLLRPEALGLILAPFSDPAVKAAYSDEDSIDLAGRRAGPVFKTPFNRERLLSHNFVNHLLAVRTDLARSIGGFRSRYDGAQDHDFLLRLTEVVPPGAITHVPQVLYHWRSFPGGGSFSQRRKTQIAEARRLAVEEHLARRGVKADVRSQENGLNRIYWPLPEKPGVTVIIPTRDRPDLLCACVAGVLHVTDYDGLDLLVVDNSDTGSAERELRAARLMPDPRISVMHSPAPFNHSALNNEAAAACGSDVFVLMNDDMLIIEPQWLTEMVALAVRPGTGAVGAKLFYPDGRIQHAGIVLGLGRLGIAGHELRGVPARTPGAQGRLLVTRRVDAVTAGCLVIERRKFLAVSGFDPAEFPVAFNDVDLCLRLEQAGLENVWTPHARLVHLESASRGGAGRPGEVERLEQAADRMKARWGNRLRALTDYHPALSRADESFSLDLRPPVQPKP
jgi:glycosyltransferase involved in cell wall biosynthesis